MRGPWISIPLCILISTLIWQISPSLTEAKSLIITEALSYDDILRGNYIDLNRIDGHVRFFTLNCSTRVSGYPGFYKAQEYIYNKFREFNLTDVQYQWYNLTVPVDMGAEVHIYSQNGNEIYSCPAYSLLPNSVQLSSTPSDGLSGALFYASQGNYGHYNGHVVNGSLVLMDFNSWDNWLKAAELGAKAVIFIEPEDTTEAESEVKYLRSVPLYMPRVYIKRENANQILNLINENGGEIKAKLISKMEWQAAKVANVIGFSPGSELKEQWLLIFAHYDAWNVVPGLSQGATDSYGISALLELARFFSQTDHKRSIMFIAFSGYGQFIAGAREFVDRLLLEHAFPQVLPENPSAGEGIVLFLGIDICPEGTGIGTFPSGYGYHYLSLSGERMGFLGEWGKTAYFGPDGFIDKMKKSWNDIYGKTWEIAGNEIFTMNWDSFAPGSFLADAEAFWLVRASEWRHITFGTLNSRYEYRYTPLDAYERMGDLANLRPQLEFIFCNLYDISMTDLSPDSILTWKDLNPTQGVPFCRLTGQVVEYNMETGYYKPIPHAIVEVSSELLGFYYRAWWFETADNEGVFSTTGLAILHSYNLRPFRVSEETGQILYAPDLGKFGSQVYPNRFTLVGNMPGFKGTRRYPYPLVAFRCGSIVLHGIRGTEATVTERLGMGSIEVAHGAGGTGFVAKSISLASTINDVRTHSVTDQFGYAEEEGAMMLFVPPRIPIEIIVPGRLSPIAVLHKGTANNPLEGLGYTIGEGENLNVLFTPLLICKELFLINNYRWETLHGKNVYTEADMHHLFAKERLDDADQALGHYEYDEYASNIISAWSLERQVYDSLRNNITSVEYSTIYVFLFLSLFSFLGERLFFSFTSGRKRALAMGIIGGITLLILTYFHPGFLLAENMYAVIFGLLILIFSGIALFFIGSGVSLFLKDLSERVLGKHFVSMGRAGALSSSLELGILQMRSRPVRSGLTLATLVLMASAIVMFTSTVNVLTVRSFTQIREAQYSGLFARNIDFGELNINYVDYLEAKFGSIGIVLPRAWAYPPRLTRGYGDPVDGPTGRSLIRGYYGLTAAEGELVGWTSALVKGRWFIESEKDVCIISSDLSRSIGADVGDVIHIGTYPMTVTGIVNEDVKYFIDLDGYRNAPFDPLAGADEPKHLYPYETLYVPYEWLLEHDGRPYTVVVLLLDKNTIGSASYNLAMERTVVIYAAEKVGKNVPVEYFSTARGYATAGYELAILPVTIVALEVLNLMLGVVYERMKEIGIYSALGLSPRTVSFIFLSEALAFAFLSSVMGYVIGIVGGNFLYAAAALPEQFHPNYSSMFVLQTLGLIVAVVMVSSIYPLMKASRLVTPSLERKWKITTHPLGDEWDIPVPFVFSSEEDADGCLEFFREYFMSYREESPVAPFATIDSQKRITTFGGFPAKSLVITLHIAPFPAGINQTTEIIAVNEKEVWRAHLHLSRKTGRMDEWISSNRKFLDAVRKQLLNWRTLAPSEKSKYKAISIETMRGIQAE